MIVNTRFSGHGEVNVYIFEIYAGLKQLLLIFFLQIYQYHVHGRRTFFFRWGPIMDFSTGSQNIFTGGQK